jgi:type IV secretory pathway protease TraF
LQVGQRVLIDQLATLSRMRRWEVIAFHDPYVQGQITVKRLVGLPGEQLAIRDGDVYIDSQLARKDLAEQRRMAVLVHDNDFRPQQETKLPARWQSDAANSRWRPLRDGFTFASDVREEEASSNFDWLTYRHWRCVLTPLPRTEEAPIRDNYGYNQGVARQLNVVRDLMLQCRVKLSGDGEFVVRCDNGIVTLQAAIQPAAGRLVLSREGREIADADWPAEFNGAPVQLVFSNIDRQAIVAAGGRVLLSRPLRVTEQRSDRPLTPTSRPFALGARNVQVSVEHLRIYRDLYYLDPRGLDIAWQAQRPLADDEVFVLGDNVPISRDSRAYSRPLKRKAVLGSITRYD